MKRLYLYNRVVCAIFLVFLQLNAKRAINAILYGGERSAMDVLHAYCDAERLEGRSARRIGF